MKIVIVKTEEESFTNINKRCDIKLERKERSGQKWRNIPNKAK